LKEGFVEGVTLRVGAFPLGSEGLGFLCFSMAMGLAKLMILAMSLSFSETEDN